MRDEQRSPSGSDRPAARHELEKTLGKLHQSLADLYRQAVQLVEQSEYNRAVVLLISHAVREISNNLAHHLGLVEGVSLPPRIDVTAAMRNLAQLYEAGSQWEGLPSEESGETKPDDLTEGRDYSIRLRQAVQGAVAANAAATGNVKRLRAFVAAWELSTDPNPTTAMFGSVFDFFMSYAHLDRAGEDRTPPKAELQENFATFETIVAARLRGFFEVGDELAAILTAANTKKSHGEREPGLGRETAAPAHPGEPAAEYAVPTVAAVDSAVARTGHIQHRRVFYSKLENPNWVVPLAKRGAFKTAPQVDGHGQANMDGWPEGEYLAKVASAAPDKVLTAVQPALANDHPVVQRIVLDIAEQVPVKSLVTILPTVRRYLQLPWRSWLDPVKLVAVIRRLVEGGCIKQARTLAQDLYQPRPATSPAADPQIVLEQYWYVQTLPDTVRALGFEPKTLSAVVGWLQEWVKAAPNAAHILSMWRHSIGADERLGHSEPVGHALVDAVRDLAHGLVNAGHPLPEVVRRVELRNMEPGGAPIFRRLALDVIAYALQSEPATAVEDGVASGEDPGPIQIAFEHLMTPEFLRRQYRPEYLLLAQSALPLLTDEQVEAWRNVIASPPHLTTESIGKLMGGFTGEPAEVTVEQIVEYIGRWQRDLLAGIGHEALPPRLCTWLDELSTRHGQPLAPVDAQTRSGFVTGPTSPLSDTAALGLSPEEMVDFVGSWEPGDVLDWRSVFPPSYEGLAGSVARAVAASPERYAQYAGQFIGLRSSYVRAFFDGLEQAIGRGQGFGWEQVLTLASHAADQPGDTGEGETWDFTQQQVARFIQRGISTGSTLAIPADLYPAVWHVLERLSRSQDPVTQDGEEPADALTESLNTTRPVALRAAIHLLAACGKTPAEAGSDATEGSPNGLVDEILAALDEHAGPEADDSLAVAAVFGEGIGTLLSAAPQWTATRLERLFGRPGDDGASPVHQAWFDTAWAVTIFGYEPSRGLFEPLKPWYMAHIEQLGTDRPEVVAGISMRSPRQALADHILMLYITGQLDGGLRAQALSGLFTHGDSTLMRDALGHLGWRLRRTEGEIPDAVLERFRSLWDWRASQITHGSADPEELLDFYWWVASGRLEASWWLPHLATVAIDPRFHAHEMLGEPLAKAASAYPEHVLEIFSALYDTSRQTMQSPDLMRHAPAILKAALNSELPDLTQQASDLAGKMGQDGHTDLMDQIRALRN